MANPLSLLREYNINKKEIIEKDDEIILGEYSFPKNTKTNFQIFGSGRNGMPKEYYTLESLVFFLKFIHLPNSLYMQIGNTDGVPLIKHCDKKKISDYLNGKWTVPRLDGYSSKEVPVTVKNIATIPTVTLRQYQQYQQHQQYQQNQDPLSLLREYNMEMKLEEIIEKNNQIIFGEHSFPKTSSTNYFVYPSGKRYVTPKRYYSLESLLFFLKKVHLCQRRYEKLAKRENIPHVKYIDKKNLLAYLTGEIDDTYNIDRDTSAEALVTEKCDASKEENEQNKDLTAKKPRLEEIGSTSIHEWACGSK